MVRLFVLAVLVGSIASPPSAAASWVDYRIVARSRLSIGPNLNLRGNYVVMDPGGTLALGQNSFQLDGSPAPFMAADTINLGQSASIVDAYTNQITGHETGEVRGSRVGFSVPVGLSLPAFPVAQACDACTMSEADISLAAGEERTLAPGCYRDLIVHREATAYLQPGSYTFKSWNIRKFGAVQADGAVQVHLRRNLKTEEGSFLGVSTGNAVDFQFWIGSETTCSPGLAPNTSRLGKFTTAMGTFVAPADTDFDLNKGVVLVGTVVADRVSIRGDHAARPPTPTPSATPTPTPTPTPTITPTPIPTSPFIPPTPTPSPTPVVTPTPIPTSPFVPPTPDRRCGIFSPEPPWCPRP